jgi:hypothetical protein
MLFGLHLQLIDFGFILQLFVAEYINVFIHVYTHFLSLHFLGNSFLLFVNLHLNRLLLVLLGCISHELAHSIPH